MSDKREVDLKNKLDEATNADQGKKEFLKNNKKSLGKMDIISKLDTIKTKLIEIRDQL